MGYNGSGKSTLANELSKIYNVPVLHLDTVHFLPNWEERSKEEKQSIVSSFLDNNQNGWIIDGNYFKLYYERRTKEADIIIQLLFSRFICLYRCIKRYFKYKGKSRSDMAIGCDEKLDRKFIKWILWGSRSKKEKERYKLVQSQYGHKVIVIKNQHQLNKFMQSYLK